MNALDKIVQTLMLRTDSLSSKLTYPLPSKELEEASRRIAQNKRRLSTENLEASEQALVLGKLVSDMGYFIGYAECFLQKKKK